MENTGEITLEEALRMLAAAKLQIEEQQQLLKSKEDVILEKELKIDTQIAIINQKNIELETEKQEKEKLRIENLRLQEELSTHLAYRFCSHSKDMIITQAYLILKTKHLYHLKQNLKPL